MEAKLQRRVQRYGWDRAAAFYERYWQTQLAPAQAATLDAARLSPGDSVIDVACGTGLVTFAAAHQVEPGGRVLGSDISANMVAAAVAAATDKGISNVSFERADAEDLGCEPASFDVAICALGLMYVPSPKNALREMYEALGTGGRVSVSIWGERRNCGWADIFPIVDRRVASDVCPMFFALGAKQSLESVMAEVGFRDATTTRIGIDLVYTNDEEALGAAFMGGPVALAYSKFDDAIKHEVHQEYLESIAEYRDGSGAYRVPGEFVIASGIK
ncbi:MAG: ubiquinone/menaquinone biosynthesis C-methylase UbiE [Candidatus Aldehydirespiratoraceae bacterium]|jgi:ubiquinone/menaquinone biosynthesis C-methylase UbiE